MLPEESQWQIFFSCKRNVLARLYYSIRQGKSVGRMKLSYQK